MFSFNRIYYFPYRSAEFNRINQIAEERPQTARDIGMVFHKRAGAPDLISSLRGEITQRGLLFLDNVNNLC